MSEDAYFLSVTRIICNVKLQVLWKEYYHIAFTHPYSQKHDKFRFDKDNLNGFEGNVYLLIKTMNRIEFEKKWIDVASFMRPNPFF